MHVALCRTALLVIALLSVAACGEDNGESSTIAAGSAGTSVQVVSRPDILRNVNPKNLALELNVAGNAVENIIKGEDNWQVTLTLPSGQATSVSALWYENFQQNRRLNLASWQDTVVFDSNTNYTIGLDAYTTSGPDFDVDGDAVSNLDERNARSNPFDPLSTPASIPTVDVIIPVIPDTASARPVIDGIYEADKYEGQNAQFSDTDDKLLFIDNLMLDAGTTGTRGGRSDGNTEMRWFAMHDQSNLYIFVVGENVDASSPFGDSPDQLWNDDNLNIFLDADNSKSASYDGVNDFRIEIPLLDSDGNANNSANSSRRILVASALPSGDSVDPPRALDVDFAACVCQPGDQHTWEVSIPMSQVGLTPRSSFGIDIQIDLDHDGQDRDIRWGWFHPSGFDSTWLDPSAMGTGYIQ